MLPMYCIKFLRLRSEIDTNLTIRPCHNTYAFIHITSYFQSLMVDWPREVNRRLATSSQNSIIYVFPWILMICRVGEWRRSAATIVLLDLGSSLSRSCGYLFATIYFYLSLSGNSLLGNAIVSRCKNDAPGTMYIDNTRTKRNHGRLQVSLSRIDKPGSA